MTPQTTEDREMGTRAASVIALLAGIWLFISPWIYRVYTAPNAWNNWIVGALIVILAATQLSSVKATGIGWLTCLLGIWTFISPWVYGYTMDHGRLINSLCVGVIVFVAALRSAMSTPHIQHPLPTRL